MDAVSVIFVFVCAAMPKVAQLDDPEADPMDLNEKMESFIQSAEFSDVLAREWDAPCWISPLYPVPQSPKPINPTITPNYSLSLMCSSHISKKKVGGQIIFYMTSLDQSLY